MCACVERAEADVSAPDTIGGSEETTHVLSLESWRRDMIREREREREREAVEHQQIYKETKVYEPQF